MRVLLILACVLFALPARADFDAGMAAYEAKDYATAYREWRPLAEAGDPRAQYWLADLYRFGLGQLINYKTALYWYKQAALQTEDVDINRRAVYALGYMVNNAQGVERDTDKALCLYKTSSEMGYANAQWALCLLYAELYRNTRLRMFYGSLVRNGFYWCDRSAAQGEPFALGYVGEEAIHNPVTPHEQGYMKIFLAAQRGGKRAQERLIELGNELSLDELALLRKGKEMAKEWREKVEPLPAKPIPVEAHCWP
ncbi:tetratricopeptide repeat protein [Magnetospira thiophila]